MIEFLKNLFMYRHYPEKTQPFWEVVMMALAAGVLGFLGWAAVPYAKEIGKSILLVVGVFYVLWIGPQLWKVLVAWIDSRRNRREQR